MSIEVAVGSQLGEALQTVVLPKLVELGWSTGMQDDTLSEYIILMLANGKTQDQIATELSTDLLDSSPDDAGPTEFAKWLFEQVHILSAQLKTPIDASAIAAPSGAPTVAQGGVANGGDEEMGNGTDGGEIPTGPKAMRNGIKQGRDKRMLGQITKSLDRSGDAALHRIRGSAGTGRINSHSREPPKGPRQQQNIHRGLAAMNGRPAHGMPSIPMGPAIGQLQNGAQFPQGMYGALPQDTMQQMMQMMEAQAAMLAQMSAAGGVTGFQPQGRFQGSHNGRPLSERVEKRGRPNHDRNQQGQGAPSQGQQDTAMGEDGEPKEGGSENTHHEPKDTSQIMCRWNLSCTKADCEYAHQSPVALGGVAVDTTIECPHGVACKNTRCTARHPSPAKKRDFQAQTACTFGPLCQRPGCPFSHPTVPACKNGADCDAADCQYWHNPVKCKFPTCTNLRCPYKHEPGQKKGPFKNATLILNGADKQHVSERKFVANEAEEELITPNTTEAMEADLQVT